MSEADNKDNGLKILPDSVKNLINIAQKEYDLENDRSKKLDTKGNMLFVLGTTPLYFTLNTLEVEQYKGLFCKSGIHFISGFLDIILLFALCMGFTATIFYALKTVGLQTFERIPLDDILSKINKYKTEHEMTIYVVAKYKDIIDKNSNINDKKSGFLSFAISILHIVFIVFVLWTIIHRILISVI